MKSEVSPKQLARAIHVSESSVKRWCDRGMIPTVRTAGGHRRITIAAVLDFLRHHEYRVVRPDLLGLPATSGQTGRMLDRAQETLCVSLLEGDEQRARGVVLDLFLAGHDLPPILDEVVARTLHQIGEQWSCGDAYVYQERRACEICVRILHELRQTIPASERGAGLAIGGTPECDPYHVPNAMVDLILRRAGWETHDLGVGLPFETLRVAVRNHQPRLFWLSVSHIDDEDRFVCEYDAFYSDVPPEVAVVVGGQALHEGIRRRIRYASFCDNLKHLDAFARSLAAGKADRDADPVAR